jgi:hypothetical protein
MHRLEPAFRSRFIELGATQGFAKSESKMARLLLRRETSGHVFHEIWVSPKSVLVTDEGPLSLAVSIWSLIAFRSLESVIAEALQDAGAEPHITDRRSARFSLRSLVGPDDPPCIQGLSVDPTQPPEAQAEAAWHFYWERVSSHLGQLSSPDVLLELNYLPPGTSRIAWTTRQLLYHANRGLFSVSASLARGVEKTAATELVSPVNSMMTYAAERGHTFIPPSDVVDYRRHPLWLEFKAVQRHVARLA